MFELLRRRRADGYYQEKQPVQHISLAFEIFRGDSNDMCVLICVSVFFGFGDYAKLEGVIVLTWGSVKAQGQLA